MEGWERVVRHCRGSQDNTWLAAALFRVNFKRVRCCESLLRLCDSSLSTALKPYDFLDPPGIRENMIQRILSRVRVDSDEKRLILSNMMCRMNQWAVRLLAFTLAKTFRILFQDVQVCQKHKLEALFLQENKVVVLVPTHKSHLDYLVMSFVCYMYNLPLPCIAAGENLDIALVGRVLRNAGAFFIKRSFREGHKLELYREVFAEMIRELVDSSSCIEFFIEGGRSRNGRLASAKLGLLKLLRSSLSEQCQVEDILILPIDITYDRLLLSEETSYVHQRQGKAKKPESLASLVSSSLSSFTAGPNHKMNVYVRFGEAISCKSTLDLDLKVLGRMITSIHAELGHVIPAEVISSLILFHRRNLPICLEQFVSGIRLIQSLSVDVAVEQDSSLEKSFGRMLKLLDITNDKVIDLDAELRLSYYSNQLSVKLFRFAVPATILCSFESLLKSSFLDHCQNLQNLIDPHFPFAGFEFPEVWNNALKTLESLGFVQTHSSIDQNKMWNNRIQLSSSSRGDLEFLKSLIVPIIESFYSVLASFVLTKSSSHILTPDFPEIVQNFAFYLRGEGFFKFCDCICFNSIRTCIQALEEMNVLDIHQANRQDELLHDLGIIIGLPKSFVHDHFRDMDLSTIFILN